jgi:hypothetical protein
LDLASAKYDQAFATGKRQMFLTAAFFVGKYVDFKNF